EEEGLLPLRAPLWLVPAFVRRARRRRRRQDRGELQKRRAHGHVAENAAGADKREEDLDQKGLNPDRVLVELVLRNESRQGRTPPVQLSWPPSGSGGPLP